MTKKNLEYFPDHFPATYAIGKLCGESAGRFAGTVNHQNAKTQIEFDLKMSLAGCWLHSQCNFGCSLASLTTCREHLAHTLTLVSLFFFVFTLVLICGNLSDQKPTGPAAASMCVCLFMAYYYYFVFSLISAARLLHIWWPFDNQTVQL